MPTSCTSKHLGLPLTRAKRELHFVLATSVTYITLMAFGLAKSGIESPRPISHLEAAVAALPLGISPDEADAIIGSTPDGIYEQNAILAHP